MNGTAAGDDSNPTSRPPQNKRSITSSMTCANRTGPTFTDQPLISGGGAAALEPFGDPELDDGLAGNPEPTGFPVKRIDHPRREVDVHPALFQRGPADRGEVQIACHIAAVVKLLIELLSPHKRHLLLPGPARGDDPDPILA